MNTRKDTPAEQQARQTSEHQFGRKIQAKAVAVKRESADSPPRITAKGHGYNAEKILDIAFAEGVKVRQDKDLTELLDAFNVESPIPLEALHAVSVILQRVHAANQDMKDRLEEKTPEGLYQPRASVKSRPDDKWSQSGKNEDNTRTNAKDEGINTPQTGNKSLKLGMKE